MISSAVRVQVNGSGLSFQCETHQSMRSWSWATELKLVLVSAFPRGRRRPGGQRLDPFVDGGVRLRPEIGDLDPDAACPSAMGLRALATKK
jgi:hypothetical protein